MLHFLDLKTTMMMQQMELLTLRETVESMWKDFHELVGISNYKKTFVKALAKIFMLLSSIPSIRFKK